MEWLFGSTKKPKPDVYVSNVVEGDFNLVSAYDPTRSNNAGVRPPYPLYPNLPGQHNPAAVYPSQSTGYHQQFGYYNPYPPQLPYTNNQKTATPQQKPINPLDSIPFKLSSGDSKIMPTNEHQLKSIKNQIDGVSSRINSGTYNYTFDLERSVLNELNIGFSKPIQASEATIS